MKRQRGEARVAHLLQALVGDPSARLRPAPDGSYRLARRGGGWKRPVPAELVRALLARGLLEDSGEESGEQSGQGSGRSVRAGPQASAWMRRCHGGPHGYLAQHVELERRRDPDAADGRASVLVNCDESPLGQLVRRRDRRGRPFLGAELVAAAERLRTDFERAQLQPRVTANWTAVVNSGRRSGDPGGMADLADAALAARQRFAAAMDAAGPELAGILVDVCCLLKGLETVERERAWPARSAKLVLRLALQALARHYGLSAAAEGSPRRRTRHWGAPGYRPRVT